MYFMGETKLPTTLLPPPDTRGWQQRGSDYRAQFSELVASNFRDQQYVQASNNLKEARFAAYDKRIADVEAATGVKMQRPWDVEIEFDKGPNVVKFQEELRSIEQRFPDKAGVIRAGDPVEQDVLRLQADTAARVRQADVNAKDIDPFGKLMAQFAGAGAASFRDPVNIATMAVKGELFAAKTVYGRVLQQVATEGALNGTAEAIVQKASEDAKRKAGLPVDDFWKQVGLATAFGGGLGGLFEGVGHVLKARGVATPETDAALSRMAGGELTPAHVATVGDALGVKLNEGDMASLSHAMEHDADTAAVLRPDVSSRDLGEAVRAIETDTPLPDIVPDAPRVPPGLRKNIPENIPEGQNVEIAQNRKLTEMLDNGPPVHLRDDPGFQAYVREQDQARVSRLEEEIAVNEADIAHLRDEGSLDSMPSGRDFSGVKAATDDGRASKVLAELDNAVTRTRHSLSEGALHVDSPAMQVAYARDFGQQQLVQPEFKTTKQATPAAPEAVEAAAQKLELAGGTKAKPLDHAAPKAAKELVKRDTLDIMDALPGGTDVNGNPVVTTHAEMSDTAGRMSDLADLIAACKA